MREVKSHFSNQHGQIQVHCYQQKIGLAPLARPLSEYVSRRDRAGGEARGARSADGEDGSVRRGGAQKIRGGPGPVREAPDSPGGARRLSGLVGRCDDGHTADASLASGRTDKHRAGPALVECADAAAEKGARHGRHRVREAEQGQACARRPGYQVARGGKRSTVLDRCQSRGTAGDFTRGRP